MQISKLKVFIEPKIILSLLLLVISLGVPWYGFSIFTQDHLHVFYNNIYRLQMILVFLCVLFPFFLIQNIKIKENNISLTKHQFWLLLFLTFSFLSVFWLNDLASFAYKAIQLFTGLIIFIVALRIKKNDFIVLAASSSFALLIITLIGIGQYLFGIPDNFVLPSDISATGGSTFSNQNIANHVVVLLFPMALYLAVLGGFLKTLIALIVIISSLMYIYLSGTKAAFIAIFIELIVFSIFYFLENRKQINFIKISLKVILPVIAFYGFISYLDSIDSAALNLFKDLPSFFEDLQKSISGSRINILRISINYFFESPVFGYGLGSFENTISLSGNLHRLKSMHNDILQLTLELGLVGLILFVLFSFYLIKDLFLIQKSTKDRKELAFFQLIFVAFCGSFFNLLVSFPYQTIHAIVIFSMYAGVVTGKVRTLNSTNLINIKSSLFINNILSYILLTLLLVSFFVIHNFISDHNNAYLNSGVGTKFNYKELKNHTEFIPHRDQTLFNFSNEYYEEGFLERSSEILSILTEFNPRNAFAIWRQIELNVKEKNVKKIKPLVDKLVKYNELNPITMISLFEYFKLKGDIENANKTYTKYKMLFDQDRLPSRFRYVRFLLKWSIILQRYEDTETLYSLLGDFKNVYDWKWIKNEVELDMVKFYSYTNQPEKGVKHLNYMSDKNLINLIPENILEYYANNGILKLDEIKSK